MFQSPFLTHLLPHRRRTMASCRWLRSAPHSPLEGSCYRVKLSIDPGFPQVPVDPGFPSQPCRVTTASEALLCGTRYALSVRPTSRPCTDFHKVTGHRGITSPTPFPCRPTYCLWIGSKEGIAPSSALRNAASPIKGTALQRLLDRRLAISRLPVWRTGVTFRSVCFCSWRPARYALSQAVFAACVECAPGKPPGLRPIRLSPNRCPRAFCPCSCIAPLLILRRRNLGTSIRVTSSHRITLQRSGFPGNPPFSRGGPIPDMSITGVPS